VLANAQKIGSWHFAPGTVHLKEGQAIQAYNKGGEAHTFTEVPEFGGGFIDELNDLVGAGDTVPQCDLFGGAPIEFIPPGETSEAEVESKGTHKYMCCIHPWMRATVTVR
jgi:plastocyanin